MFSEAPRSQISVLNFFRIAQDCPELENPENGTVTAENRLYPNEATYTCNDGFSLEGDATRMCQINGEWAGEAPTCVATEECKGKILNYYNIIEVAIQHNIVLYALYI